MHDYNKQSKAITGLCRPDIIHRCSHIINHLKPMVPKLLLVQFTATWYQVPGERSRASIPIYIGLELYAIYIRQVAVILLKLTF